MNNEVEKKRMSIPPSVKAIFPSFCLSEGFAVINISDLKNFSVSRDRDRWEQTDFGRRSKVVYF